MFVNSSNWSPISSEMLVPRTVPAPPQDLFVRRSAGVQTESEAYNMASGGDLGSG